MKKRIFGLLMALVMVCSLLPVNVLAVRAEDLPKEPSTPTKGTIGSNITWVADTSTGVVTFSGTGEMSAWTNYNNYPDYWKYAKVVVIEEGITSVGARRFASSKILEKVILPNTVTEIGDKAFAGSKYLTKVEMGEGITSIGAGAFNGCAALVEIDFPDTVTEIGEYAFYNCTGLKDFNWPNGLKEIGSFAFYGCTKLKNVTLPTGLEKIGNYGFYGCTALEHIALPTKLTYIGNRAFENCSKLDGVVLPDSLTYLGERAFYKCSELTKIAIPDGVEELHSELFYSCKALEKIYIPESVYSIGSDAFGFCGALTEIYYGGRQTDWDNISRVIDENNYGNMYDRCCQIIRRVTKYYDCKGPECVLEGHLETVLPAVAPTCTESGKTEGVVCGVCGKVLTAQSTVPAVGHTAVTYKGVAATCTETGLTDGKRCSVCDAVLLEREIIPAKGHRFNEESCENCGLPAKTILCEGRCGEDWDNAKYVLYADGTLEISGTGKMMEDAFCNEGDYATMVKTLVVNEGIASVGGCFLFENLETVHLPVSVTVVSGCAFQNCSKLKDIYYAGCPAQYEAITVEIEGSNKPFEAAKVHFAMTDCEAGYHTEVIDEEIAATCTETGLTEGKHCGVCDAVLVAKEIIPSLGHTEGESVEENRKEASCEQAGSYEEAVYCTVCKAELSRTEHEIPAVGHTGGAAVRENEAAAKCEQAGSYEEAVYCTVCKAELSRTEHEIPAVGHTGGAAVRENEAAAKCEQAGSYEEAVYCTVCKAEVSRTEYEIPVVGHKDADKDYQCDVCGAKLCTDHQAVTVKGIAAACEKDGLTDGSKCGKCGEVLKEQTVIPAKGHTKGTPVKENSVPATCEQGGSYEEAVYCTVCKAELSHTEYEIPAVGHKDADKDYQCDVCGAKLCTDHQAVTFKGIAAACEKDGLTDGSKCGKCGEVLKEQTVIPAKGHTKGTPVKENSVPATCEQGGSYEEAVYCTVCKAELSHTEYEIPAVGHKDADKDYKCDVCGAKLCTNHRIVTVKGTAATCLKAGLTDGSKCDVCGEIVKEQQAIPALGHSAVVVAGYQATCEKDGLTDGASCSVCHETLIKQTVIPAKGHMEAKLDAKAPTCTEEGLTEGVCCSVCGEVLSARTAIPAKGHEAVALAGKAPTCTDSGLTEGTCCRICDAVLTERELIPAVGHSFRDGVCKVCGEADPNYKKPVVNPFIDVKDSDWFFEAVMWAVEHEVTGGTSPDTFSPYRACTRAQIVQFLWAANGRPEPTTEDNPFTDVDESDWYYQAVLWAVEKGITGGTSADAFSPEQTCTRAQVVTFLYAAAGKPRVNGANFFTDVPDDAWYVIPVLWAVEHGITGGVAEGVFGSDQACTRSQIALFLYKAMG